MRWSSGTMHRKKWKFVAVFLTAILALSGAYLILNLNGEGKALADDDSGTAAAGTFSISIKNTGKTNSVAKATLEKSAYNSGETVVVKWKGATSGSDFLLPTSITFNNKTYPMTDLIQVDKVQEENTLYNKLMNDSVTYLSYTKLYEYATSEHSFSLGKQTIGGTVTVNYARVTPVYRLYNKVTSEHLFTTDKKEYDDFVYLCEVGEDNWIGEGIDWLAPAKKDSGISNVKTVKRLYNSGLGSQFRSSHYYTSDESEIKELTTKYGWVLDDESNFFASGSTTGASTPIYTAYSELLGSSHHYTSSWDEWQGLDAGWDKETTKNGLSKDGKSATGVAKALMNTNWRYTDNYYKVNHYQDGQLVDTQYVSGKAGNITNAKANSYPGYKLSEKISQTAIASNNSTVVNVNYTKQTYTVKFVTNDSSVKVKDQSVKYGETVTNPGRQTASGKYFLNWCSDASLKTSYNFSKAMPATSMTLYANWGNTTSTTDKSGLASLYDADNGDYLKITVKYLDGSTLKPVKGATVESHTAYSNGDEAKIKIQLPSTAEADGKHVSVSVKKVSGKSETSLNGKTIQLIDSTGEDMDRGSQKTSGDGDVIFADYGVKFVWVNESGEETEVSTEETLDHGQTITRPTTDPTMDGYKFVDWYTDGSYSTKYEFDKTCTSNVKIYAKFLKVADWTNTSLKNTEVEYTKAAYTPEFENLPQGMTADDYTLSYKKESGEALESAPSDVGKYKVDITPTGNFTGEKKEFSFEIKKANLANAIVTLDDTVLTYNGEKQTKNISSVTLNGATLTEGTDYKIDNNSNQATEANEHTITLEPASSTTSYEGTNSTAKFTIEKKDLKVSGVTVESKTYDGKDAATLKVESATYDGIVNSDEVSINPAAHFENKDAGTNKKVDATLQGAKASNYNLVDPDLKGTIDTIKVTVNGVTAPEKVIDTATEADSDLQIELDYSGATATAEKTVEGETVTVATDSPATGTVENRDLNSAKKATIEASQYKLAGPEDVEKNYVVDTDKSQKEVTVDYYTKRYFINFHSNGSSTTNTPTGEMSTQNRLVGDSSDNTTQTGVQVSANAFKNVKDSDTYGMKYWTKTQEDVTDADLTGTVPDPASGSWVRDKSFGDLVTEKIYETKKEVNLYAQWTSNPLGAYWMAEGMVLAPADGTNNSTTNKFYNNPESSVIKTKTDVAADVATLKSSEESKANDKTAKQEEYKKLLKSDEHHLYTSYTQSGQTGENTYAEFRVIQVGAHQYSATGSETDGSVLTFHATHMLPGTYAMTGKNSDNSGGWVSGQASYRYGQPVYKRMQEGGSIFKEFSSEFTNDILKVKKNYNDGSKTKAIKTSEEKLFLLSYSEIAGETTGTYASWMPTKASEGVTYDYFKKKAIAGTGSNPSLVYTLRSGTGGAGIWWLRSPSQVNSQWGSVNSSGNPSQQQQGLFTRYVAPAFCF